MPELSLGLELLLIALMVALITKHTKRPYTIALVIWGLILGLLQLIEPFHLSKELVMVFFLPPLLFEGALHIQSTILRRRAGLVLVLALVGTLITALVVGLGAHLIFGFDLLTALLLGVIVAPTDPVSVLATFRNAKVERDLSTIVEGESLFNDGIAVVIYIILLEALTGGMFTPLSGAGDFLIVVGGGATLGLGLGMLVTRFMRRMKDHLVEVMVTLILVYGTYLLAEHLHLSGVIAVAIAGLVVGNHGLQRTSTYSRQSIVLFWGIIAFLVNSVVFLLIGFELHLAQLIGDLLSILAIFAILLLARLVAVYGLGALNRWRMRDKPGDSLPWKWLPVITWGGMRGAVPVALALGLPLGLPHRDELITLVFGVVLFSLLIQGLSMPAFIRRLGLSQEQQEQHKGHAIEGVGIS